MNLEEGVKKLASEKRVSRKKIPTAGKGVVLPKAKAIPDKKTPVATSKAIRKSSPAKVTSRSVLSVKAKLAKLKEATEEDTVTLIQGAPSLRLQEKLALYQDWYQKNAPLVAGRVAYGFGYFFIVSGLFSALLVSAQLAHPDRSMLASVHCSVGGLTNTGFVCPDDDDDKSGTTTPGLVNPPSNPPAPIAVEFFPLPAIESNRDTELVIRILNYSTQKTKLRSLTTGQVINLEPLHISGDGMHTFLLPTSTLSPGSYQVLVKVVGLTETLRSEYLGTVFTVPLPVIDGGLQSGTSPSQNPSPNATTTNVTNPPAPSPKPDSLSTTSPNQQPTPISAQPPATITEKPEEVVVPPLPDRPTPEPEELVDERLKLSLSAGVLPQQYRLLIESTNRYDVIEVYARRQNATMPQFLGRAVRTSENWLYWLDASSLPVGRYKLVAHAYSERQLKQSVEIDFVIEPRQTTRIPNQVIIEEAEETRVTERSLIPAKAEERTPATAESDQSGTDEEPGIAKQAIPERVLLQHREGLNDLLSRYATARQSQDPMLLRLAEVAIDEKIYAILAEDAKDPETDYDVYTLERSLREQIIVVQERIKQVQELRRERTGEAGLRDSDNDGISDNDEAVLYETDPTNPDTDNDGVTDGIEVMGGFNPLDASPEAIIRFNEPQAVEYVDDTILSISSVAPLLLHEADSEVPIVQSHITGFGLPNSFVTLFIFSEPIVVTVRTNDDGSFSYTLEKELADGEHTVYAALTDNRGQIVVRSTAFSFVKTAEAFTYVGEDNNAEIITATGPTTISAPYNLAAALGVVSFGLILLMLGYTSRRPRPDEILPKS